jgi:hypothetical protein
MSTFFYPSITWWILQLFHFLVIMNGVAINMGVQIFNIQISFPLAMYLVVGLLDHMAVLFLIFFGGGGTGNWLRLTLASTLASVVPLEFLLLSPCRMYNLQIFSPVLWVVSSVCWLLPLSAKAFYFILLLFFFKCTKCHIWRIYLQI